MAKPTSRFVCQSCGAVTLKWAGRCETCGEWNTVEEEAVIARPGPAAKAPVGRSVAFVGLAGSAEPPPRAPIGIAELDRVLGGGLVPASVVLVGGDPGIGKSTLLLQAAARLARSGRRVLYVTGRNPSIRSASAPAASVSPTHPLNWPPQSMSATSPPASNKPRTPPWW